ncbi:hypothetical protein R1sor_009631 [Riccia sorocarpa]|uniref:Uncharacterized protein n=1 Tax=Riccia sorocarpa TaxID=122646 RepID=A0ABD3HZN2_9MARC
MEKSSSSVLPLLLVLLLSAGTFSAAVQSRWILYANNLSGSPVEIHLCADSACSPLYPENMYLVKPKSVLVIGPTDPHPEGYAYLIVTDDVTKQHLNKKLWYGQLDASNRANILSIVKNYANVTQFQKNQSSPQPIGGTAAENQVSSNS